MSQITTEITSSQIKSDAPLHYRLLYAYHSAKQFVNGNLLEIGCGEGRGIEELKPLITHYTAIDKNVYLLNKLKEKYPNYSFVEGNIPPLSQFQDNSFDTVVTFQVIEHIGNDHLFVKEIYRVLKPNGKLLLSTPNIEMTLTRNPWHEREYTPTQLTELLKQYFDSVQPMGITGDQEVFDYYQKNKKSVQKITRFDIFNLQYKLPASWLRLPYDILNRLNRNKLMKQNLHLINNIGLHNYSLTENTTQSFDLFYIATKK
jgi:ubiquinone/menaquinone biosynthesis C-methylase UbiE